MGACYTVDRAGAGEWYLASDDTNDDGKIHRIKASSTFHAGWFGAWDDEVMAMWIDRCINRRLNCNGGELGDGTVLKPQFPLTYRADPRLVPIPARP